MRKCIAFLLLVLWLPAYAGTWGSGVFDSDQALDTSSDWAESGTVDDIRKALDGAKSESYLDAPDAEDALVAAEVVAASWGKPNEDLPADLSEWIESQSSAELRALTDSALAAIASVRRTEGSELHELWAEGSAAEWLSHLDDLASRLRAGSAGHER